MLYEKALKELNTVFPKLNIKAPTKKAIISSLIQQIQCPYLSNNDFLLLRNPETASKGLKKLAKLIEMWIKIVENNQKARQQQENFYTGLAGKKDKDKDRNNRIQQIEYMLVQAQQVADQQQFIMFIQQKGQIFYGSRSVGPSLKDHKETLIPKQQQFYNTITKIPEQQYFHSLEQLLEKLGILQQLIQNQLSNMDHLQELNAMLDKEELFKKKDNLLNQVVNFNLCRARLVAEKIERERKVLYFYQEEFTFAIARCYFGIYLAESEIQRGKGDQGFLEAVEAFLTERREWVFPKLYAKIIVKPLIQMERIRQDQMAQPYQIEHLTEKQVVQTKTRIEALKSSLSKNNKSLLTEPQFLQFYTEIESLLVQNAKQIRLDKQNVQYKENRKMLVQWEKEVLGLFVNEADKEKEKSVKSRKVLSVANSRLSSKSRALGDAKSNKNQLSQHNSLRNTHKTDKSGHPSPTIDLGTDVFIEIAPQSANTKQKKQKIEALSKNNQEFEKECKTYIDKIKPEFGEYLEDAQNFNVDQLNTLLEAGIASASNAKQKQILTLISKNLIKPEITEHNMNKIFQPELRFNVLKLLSEKLIKMGYDNTKVLDGPEFQKLPENIKKFIETRNTFLKVVNKQMQKVIEIANVISKLEIKKKYDICKHETYDTFLKILLAQKQAGFYQLSFKDEKKVSRETSFFVKNKIYGPFLYNLSQLLPNPYNDKKEIVDVLDQLQFFGDFIHYTDEIVYNFMKDMEMDKEKKVHESQKKELARILTKWTTDASGRLEKRKDPFLYETAQSQLKKLNEIISICNNVKDAHIKDPTALKIQKLIDLQK